MLNVQVGNGFSQVSCPEQRYVNNKFSCEIVRPRKTTGIHRAAMCFPGYCFALDVSVCQTGA